MVTCKYCGSELYFIGEYRDEVYFNCSFCKMNFTKDETSVDRNRVNAVPEAYDHVYSKPTKKLLKYNTIELFHMLKDCRQDWYNILELMRNAKKHKKTEEDEKIFKELYVKYINLTKQKFVIENIILEKAGFIPEKITDAFLTDLVKMGRESTKRKMYIYV